MRIEDIDFRDRVLRNFWSKVDKTDGCWLWTGAAINTGYGIVRVGVQGVSRGLLAHRMSFVIANGSIPDDLWACHTCDVRLCVRPGHLFLGTDTDNARDMVRKGRHFQPVTIGTANPSAKLNEDDVRTIRMRYSAGESINALARAYGVSNAPIAAIIHGKCWTHVEGTVTMHGPVYAGKLSAEQHAEIRKRCAAGERQAAVARSFGIHPSHVSNICSNKRCLPPVT